MVRYHQISNNDEYDELDDEKHFKPKRKETKVWFETYRRGVYCQNCYNEGHYAFDNFLYKRNNHNIEQCLSKLMGGRCPTIKIVLLHGVQVEALVIQKDKQQNYEIFNNEKKYGNQSYNSRKNNQNWQGN